MESDIIWLRSTRLFKMANVATGQVYFENDKPEINFKTQLNTLAFSTKCKSILFFLTKASIVSGDSMIPTTMTSFTR